MDQVNKELLLLELIDKPVLCVKDGIITQMNRSAAQMQIPLQSDISDLLGENRDVYASFVAGQLSLTLWIAALPHEATVIRTEEADLFLLESPQDTEKLQAVALAAQHLRIPLNDVMTLTDQLLSNQDLDEECAMRSQAQKINKGLFQLLRLISNMADAQRYMAKDPLRMETLNLTALMDEIFEKAAILIKGTSIKLIYKGLDHIVIGQACAERLERAVYNLISNAVKFSPKGGTVEASLAHNGKQLSLSILDQGPGIPPHIYSNLYTRYQRQPGIEDGRHGIGVGMSYIRGAATAHGGTVLIDHPSSGGTRVTMTIAITESDSNTVRSPILQMFDYTGGWDHALVELSEALPASAYNE